MIPIILGPTGMGYTSVQIYDHCFNTALTDGSTIPVGDVVCITGPTGATGATGPMNGTTGPSALYGTTGATGTSIEAVMVNPDKCILGVYTTDGDVDTFGPFVCTKTPTNHTGPTGATGPRVKCVTAPFSDLTVKTVYSDCTTVTAGICCVCQPAPTGPTGSTGATSPYGTTGPAGANGSVSQTGATGPMGPSAQGDSIISATVIRTHSHGDGILYLNVGGVTTQLDHPVVGGVGPPGVYTYFEHASGWLDTEVRFTVYGSHALKRPYVPSRAIRDVLFPYTMLGFNMSYDAMPMSDAFSASGDGIRCVRPVMFRIHLEWDCTGSPYLRPYAVLNLDSAVRNGTYPVVLSALSRTVDTPDTMCCMANAGDVISVVPGAFALYPIPATRRFMFEFRNVRIRIIEVLDPVQ